jgi:hypothetical protein
MRPHRSLRSENRLHGPGPKRRVESEAKAVMAVTVAAIAIVRAVIRVIAAAAVAVAVAKSRAPISRHKKAGATLTLSARIASLATSMQPAAAAMKRRVVRSQLVNNSLNLLRLLRHPQQKALWQPLHQPATRNAVSAMSAAAREANAAVVAVEAGGGVAAVVVARMATSRTKAAAAVIHPETTPASNPTNRTPAVTRDRAGRRVGLNLSTPRSIGTKRSIANIPASLRPRRQRRNLASPKLRRPANPKAATSSPSGARRRAAAAVRGAAAAPARRDARTDATSSD